MYSTFSECCICFHTHEHDLSAVNVTRMYVKVTLLCTCDWLCHMPTVTFMGSASIVGSLNPTRILPSRDPCIGVVARALIVPLLEPLVTAGAGIIVYHVQTYPVMTLHCQLLGFQTMIVASNVGVALVRVLSFFYRPPVIVACRHLLSRLVVTTS